MADSIRFATFNASLNRNAEGQLVTDLSTPNNAQAKAVAEIIQRSNPDVLLINEFDYDAEGQAVDLFRQNYLSLSQNGAAPVEYPYAYVAPSNTGVASGFDLDNSGSVGGPNDALGFGFFPGQYGMVVYSKYPIETANVRTFQDFLWKDMPDARLPDDPNTAQPNDWYSAAELDVVRLSSKSHWDVPIEVNGEIIHALVSHPTPPVFDGPEDRNGTRNADEIRFWSDYITPGQGSYIYDDQGSRGGLTPGSRFVIMGDQNSDPLDGDSIPGAIQQLLDNPLVNTSVTPTSPGGPEQAALQGGANTSHASDPRFDTADFADTTPGNLRADYVLPSNNLQITDAQVFWPESSDPQFSLVGTFNPTLPGGFPSSDHRLVWVDTVIPSRSTVSNVSFLGELTFPTGLQFNGTQVGGLSGITYDPSRNLYYSIADDRSEFNPARFYTLSINLSDGRLDSGDVTFEDVTTLRDASGNPFAPLSLDPEGIALTEQGTVFVSSEGEVRPDLGRVTNPFVNEFSLTGQQLSALPIPDRFLASPDNSGIRNNLAFESLTISPDGRYLYTATENALKQDGPAADPTQGSPSRILKYDLVTRQEVGEFVYLTEPVAAVPNPPEGFSTNGLVDLLAIDNSGTLLALERSFSTGVGNTVKLFEIRTQGALDVSGQNDLFDEATGAPFEIDPPVAKRELLDFASLGLTPDNLEGITLGPKLPDGRQSLIVVADNNFSPAQATQFITLALDVDNIPVVLPQTETPQVLDTDEAVPSGAIAGDADDPAIWVNPTDSAKSLVISSLKDGGLAVFDLNGALVQSVLPAEYGDIRYNNVDVLYGFELSGRTVDLAIASDRENDTLAIYQINPATGRLNNATSSAIPGSIFGLDDGEQTAYGLTTYTSPISGKQFVFVSQREGDQIAQLELVDDGSGKVTAVPVRTLTVPIPEGGELEDAQVEGMVADRELGYLYVAQENRGIYKFSAEPGGSTTGTLLDAVKPEGSNLEADAEGLTIYYGADGKGYLLASSQGDSTFAVYRREGGNAYVGNFAVGASGSIDSVEESDGADLINVPLGPQYPFGLLVVHDGANDPQVVAADDGELENTSTNFKFVGWQDVANAFPEPLEIDPNSFDPRNPTPITSPVAEPAIQLKAIGTYASGIFDAGGAEIVAYDPQSQRLFVVNAENATIDILSASNPSQPTLLQSIDISSLGAQVNSVDVYNGIVAAAIENENTQAPGVVGFFDVNGQLLNSVTVGSLPDMVTFSPDGRKVLVANEGEPSSDYSVDPEGSISIIDLSAGVANLSQSDVTTADFRAFNNQLGALRSEGVRIFGPNASVAQDIEPEYITVSEDSSKAWVSLQENNALAVVDLATGKVTDILPLGAKDHSQAGNGLDVSDRDGGINIARQPVLGLYQPDGIAAYEVNGQTFIVTANEGDARDYDAFAEEARVKDLSLDPTAFPNAAQLQADDQLGRLNVTTANGDTDGDGDFDQLYAFGGRSFSIRTAEGQLVFDSGDDFERITAALLPNEFNSDNAENGSLDSRSDNKGPEPEGVTTGVIDGRTYAFIGLERIGGVMVYDVTDPYSASFVQYINNRDFSGDAETGTAGDLGPEGLAFISANDSPNGKPLLAVGNEVSGTTTLYEINLTGAINGSNRGETLVGTAEVDLILGLGGNDTLAGLQGNDRLYGGNGNDVLRGDQNIRTAGGLNGGDDLLYGGNGNDRLGGKAGNDLLYGEAGNDQLWGDAGDDLLDGGKGNDQLNGGKGSDVFVLRAGDGSDSIYDLRLGQGDRLGLANGLTFADLSLTQGTGGKADDTLVRLTSSGELLATLNDVQVSSLTSAAFVSV
ncbi:phytase [Leptolyngbya sp. FACHB-261]|uniref:phytase n=1 Tax=Leptolyngbya sp. FACHB-261 TaxID=2692806 RepID=UPI00168947FF|nr:phytase [Leptolyngbya sp. FACHB-261]MBD2104712.1 phytase [Leptolyngbya sp. FACHB-261]